MMDTTSLLDVRGLSKRFDASRSRWFSRSRPGHRGGVSAVEDVSFTLERGEVLGIVGESGSGKTTIARMLVRLVQPTAGQMLLDGRDLCTMSAAVVQAELRPKVRLIFQDPDAVLNPASTIGASLRRAISAQGDPCDHGAVIAQLERVGLGAGYADKYPDQLSGGEKRRIGICRALSTNPSLIVADEPLSGLDVMLQEHMLSLLKAEQARTNFGLILVSHDLERVHQVCDRVLVMQRGRVVEIAVVNRRRRGGQTPYTHPYSLALEAARLQVTGAGPSA